MNKLLKSSFVISLLTLFVFIVPFTVFADDIDTTNNIDYEASVIDDNNKNDTNIVDEGNYKIVISDEADLLSDGEKTDLIKEMKNVAEKCNVAFVSVNSNPYGSVETLAENYYRQYFGTDTGTLFAIDMDTRELYIFSDGDAFRKINSSKAYEITDRVYKLASKEQYFECAKKVYFEEYIILNGGFIFSPLRIITGCLFGISVSLIVCIIIVFVSRKPSLETGNVSDEKWDVYMTKKKTLIKRTKTHHSSGGGSSSGGGGGGGGGGSSGGGGGHSF